MKPIRFTQKLFALLIALTASVASFSNNHEETNPDWTFEHDFVVNNYAYYIIPESSNSILSVALIEARGHSGHIDIPAHVTHNDTTYQVSTLGMGGSVFRECRDLTSVYIPKEIIKINNNPFTECSNLTNISVDPENKYYDSPNLCHALVTSPQNPYDKPNMLIAACKNTTIPNGVEVIGAEAFRHCYNLKQVIIPNCVTTIRRSAFNGCNQLSTLVIGEGISTIEEYAFADCSALQTVMCLATTPPFLRNFAFANTPVDALDEVHEIALQLPVYVPDQSIDLYKRAWPWSNFNIHPLSKANSLAYKSQWCDKWTTFFEDADVETEEKTWIYELEQDTIINQHAYTVVNRYTTRERTETSKEYVAAVRFTDDKKIYIFYDNAEYLLYDFNVEKGDVIEVFAGINNYSEQNKTFRCTVHEVKLSSDTALSEIRLYVHPNDMTAQIHKTIWIEGVGDTQGFMMLNGFNYPRKTSSALVCASRYGKYQYMMSESEMEELNTKCYCDFNFEDNAKEGKLGGRPTPTQWYQLYEKTQMMKLRSANANNNNSIESAETFVYELLSDTTLINEKKYLPLICSATQDNVDSTSYVGALHFSKEDEVYFHYNDTEYLLYDFGAQVGDTLELFAGVENYHNQQTYTHVVTHKDTLSDGRTIITLNTLLYDDQQTEQRHKTVWIAGVGSLDGIVHNSATLVKNDHATTMLCAWLDDECVYTTDLPFYKSLGCIYNNNAETSVENIEIPTKNEGDKFLRNGQLFILHNGRTYNVFGVLVK